MDHRPVWRIANDFAGDGTLGNWANAIVMRAQIRVNEQRMVRQEVDNLIRYQRTASIACGNEE
mgnify:CR=1 FL=1